MAKQREQDRLLPTVLIARGAILATFKEKVTELNLLAKQGDTLTLALREDEPFVEDPLDPNKVPTPYGTFNSVCEVV